MTDIWVETLAQLNHQMTKATFNAWLKQTSLLSLKDGIATIQVKSNVAKEWIEARLIDTINRTLTSVNGSQVDEIKIVVGNGEVIERQYVGEYRDPKNAIIQPNKVEVHTQYFRKHWRPLLGPVLSELVRELRQQCYYGNNENSQRPTTDTTHQDLAKALGVSRNTIRRALKRDKNGDFSNEYLHYFIKNIETVRTRKNDQIRTVGTRFTIWMDDDLIPSDKAKIL